MTKAPLLKSFLAKLLNTLVEEYQMNHLIRVVFCISGVTLMAVAPANAQLLRWEMADGGNGHIYEIVSAGTSGISWTAAQSDAVRRGGHLATLTTAAENNFVFDNLVNDNSYWTLNSSVYLGPWIGGFQPQGSQEPDGGWQWVNGDGLFAGNYANWRPNEPNNFSDRVENVVNFFNFSTTPSNGWNDFRANVLGPSYVVEYAVPEPAAFPWAALISFMWLGRRRRRRQLG